MLGLITESRGVSGRRPSQASRDLPTIARISSPSLRRHFALPKLPQPDMKSNHALLLLFAVAGLTFAPTVFAKEHRHGFAREIKRQVVEIEVTVLLEKYNDVIERIHRLDLDRISLEVELEFAENETEKRELSRQLEKVSLLQDRLQDRGHQTRDEIFHMSRDLDEEREEDEESPCENEELENELRHLHREIEALHEDGKHHQARRLELRAKRIHEEMEQHECHEEEHRHHPSESDGDFEKLIEQRREAMAHLKELAETLEQLDGRDEESEGEREQLEKRASRVESHLDQLNRELESLEKRRQGE